MIEIPQNPKPRDFEGKIERAIRAVLSDSRLLKFGFSDRLCMNHNRAREDWGQVYILQDEALEIARRFKEKGYHAHYCRSMQGRPYCLTITTYATNEDI